ncbi:MAG TPA: tail fiber protein [Pyrinomonadaceae bacterium]|nr:tail fiber protein [Pyrinomonadaceae bacterium]
MLNPYVGEIRLFAFNFPPSGWLPCAGQLLPMSQNTTLFSLLGTSYGGDGRTTFGLPDLRSVAPQGLQYCISLQGVYPRQLGGVSPVLGELSLFPYSFSPNAWLRSTGQLMPVSESEALFEVLGTRFGGDGVETFGLPDLSATPPPDANDDGSLYFITVFGNPGSPAAFLATVQLMPFAAVPAGWAACDGQLLPINQNQELFSLLGTKFGGDGVTTFGLPDLRQLAVPAGTQYCISVSNAPAASAAGLGSEELAAEVDADAPADETGDSPAAKY